LFINNNTFVWNNISVIFLGLPPPLPACFLGRPFPRELQKDKLTEQSGSLSVQNFFGRPTPRELQYDIIEEVSESESTEHKLESSRRGILSIVWEEILLVRINALEEENDEEGATPIEDRKGESFLDVVGTTPIDDTLNPNCEPLKTLPEDPACPKSYKK